jgi:hypothetical protein
MAILADAGVPMLFVEYPAMLCGLIPVILVEFVVARKMLKVAPASAFKGVAIANLISTVIGFPLLWILLVLVELSVGGGSGHGLRTFWSRVYAVTVQAPWLIPYESELKWMIPLAFLYLMIPAFFTSVFLERWIWRKYWQGQDCSNLRRFSWVAHVVSYAVLLVAAALVYVSNPRHG